MNDMEPAKWPLQESKKQKKIILPEQILAQCFCYYWKTKSSPLEKEGIAELLRDIQSFV